MRVSDDWRAAGIAVFTSRLAIVLVGWLAVASIPFPRPVAQAIFTRTPRAYTPAGFFEPTTPVSREASVAAFWDLPVRGSAQWQVRIAAEGYGPRLAGEPDRVRFAFFPAYPLLMRAGAAMAGVDVSGRALDARDRRALVLVGALIALGAFAWALAYLHRLARDLLGGERARDAVMLIAVYPFSVVFGAVYPDALLLLASTAAVYHARRAEWGRASVWGALAALTRADGCLLTVSLALVDAVHRPIRHRLAARALAVAAPGLGLLAYTAFVFALTGDPFAWAVAEAWGHPPPLFDEARGVWWRATAVAVSIVPLEAVTVVAAAGAAVLVWPIGVRFGPAFASLVALPLAPPLLTGGLLATGRVAAGLFPIFLYLAADLPDRGRAAALVALATLQGLAAAWFFTWRPIG